MLPVEFLQLDLYLFSIFILILISNVLGLIPYTQILTGQLIFTLTLTTISFLIICITGFVTHRIFFLKLLLPSGTPFILIPLIVPIEFISFFSRLISLSVRLFANMTAGHILLEIFSSFALVLLLLMNGMLFTLSITLIILISVVLVLEIVIAGVQAYVFITLLTLYLTDLINIH